MRSRRVIIGMVIAAVVLVGAVGAWAYDHGKRDTIARGVHVGGVDVGGMSAEQARSKLRERLLSSLQRPVVATYDGRRVVLSAKRAGVAVNVEAAVDEALARGREGSIFARLGREVTGGSVDADVQPRVVYSRIAVEHFLAETTDRFDRAPRDASIAFSPTSLEPVAAQDGVTVQRRALRRAVVHALTTAHAPNRVPVRVRTTKPKVTTAQLAAKYPVVITVDRGSFRLRIWKGLKLEKTYTIAVGMAGLETPVGRLHDQEQAGRPGLERAEQRRGPATSPGSRSRPVPPTRSRRAGWGYTPAPASTAPRTSARSAAPPRTAASGWRFRT